jgi:glycerol-3-phosphate acyltransferase PlsX
MRRRMDYSEYGGAPLLGVNGVVTIAHGRADDNAIKNALRLARHVVESGMLQTLRDSFGRETRAEAATAASESRA